MLVQRSMTSNHGDYNDVNAITICHPTMMIYGLSTTVKVELVEACRAIAPGECAHSTELLNTHTRAAIQSALCSFSSLVAEDIHKLTTLPQKQQR